MSISHDTFFFLVPSNFFPDTYSCGHLYGYFKSSYLTIILLFCILCRTFLERKEDNAKTLDFMPITSQAIKSSGALSNPGSIVWAKTACQVWWPAEVIHC